ncbi:unnamed protein product [Prunus brigantina]
MNNQDGGDRTHGTREVVTSTEFETFCATMEEVRHLLLGMENQNPPPRPNGGARVQLPIVERRPLLKSEEESEELLHEQPLIAPNQNNRNQYMDDFRIKANIPYF